MFDDVFMVAYSWVFTLFSPLHVLQVYIGGHLQVLEAQVLAVKSVGDHPTGTGFQHWNRNYDSLLTR